MPVLEDRAFDDVDELVGWEPSGPVHVELCETEPEDKAWADREVGAWVESHATYTFLG